MSSAPSQAGAQIESPLVRSRNHRRRGHCPCVECRARGSTPPRLFAEPQLAFRRQNDRWGRCARLRRFQIPARHAAAHQRRSAVAQLRRPALRIRLHPSPPLPRAGGVERRARVRRRRVGEGEGGRGDDPPGSPPSVFRQAGGGNSRTPRRDGVYIEARCPEPLLALGVGRRPRLALAGFTSQAMGPRHRPFRYP